MTAQRGRANGRRGARLATVALGLGVAATAGDLRAQQVRATGTTTVRYLEVRPLEEDSVPVDATRGEGLLRRSADGEVVRCVQGDPFCRFLTSADEVIAAPVVQDLELSVWGLGRGIRAYSRLRGRAVAGGGGDLWPLSSDHFEALTAWVEVDRPQLRARLGRQWSTSGLGFYNFDGIALLVRALDPVTIEAWGGRSLLRGTSEPRTGDVLAAVEPFAPDEGELLVGTRIAWRPVPGTSVAAVYQRQIRRDRKGLFAERLAMDGVWRRARLRLEGSLEVDLATHTLNEARAEAGLQVDPRVGGAAFARHHRPFFEAWTIWGAFSPVAFDEVGARAWWRPSPRRLTVEARAAWRHYGDADAATTFETYRDTGWRLSSTASITPAPAWAVQLRLGTDVGFGAARDDASVRVQRTFARGGRLAASAMAFERVYEFRVDEGTVWGVGVDGGMALADRVRVDGAVTGYFHRTPEGVPERDWSQLRGSLTARWTVGAEPGVPGGVP